MVDQPKDQPLLDRIQHLASEEHRLYSHGSLSDADQERLAKIKIELDQCWDFLRQREALRAAGKDPKKAHVRPPKIVENYEQ
jgi:uncharacterized protein DUF2630